MPDRPPPDSVTIAFATTALALVLGTLAHASAVGDWSWGDTAPPPEPDPALLRLLGLEATEAPDEGSGDSELVAVDAPTAEGSGDPWQGDDAFDAADDSGADDGSGEGSGSGDGSGDVLANDEPPIPGLVPFEPEPTDDELAERENVPEIVDDGPGLTRIEPSRTYDDEPCRVRANRAVMTREVRRREPVPLEGPLLADGYPAIAYLDTQNTTGRRQPLRVQWTQLDTGTVYRSSLSAGASHRWRTWAERVLPLSEVGPWRVEVLDADRCLVASMQFELRAPAW